MLFVLVEIYHIQFLFDLRCPCNIFFAYQQQATETSTEVSRASMNLQIRLSYQVPILQSDLFGDQSPLEGIRIVRTLIVRTAIYTIWVLRKILRCFLFLSVSSLSLLSPVPMRFVVRLEEQFSVFVAGDHYCTSWSHFDYAWSQTWKEVRKMKCL